jgi:hypothetical protein
MEPAWRAGVVSVLQLSKEYGVSRAAILKHWDKANIGRDLTAKIRAKAEALVTQSAVTPKVTPEEKRVTENAIIDANAKMQADIILNHRIDVPQKRELVAKLFAEVDAITDGGDLLEQLTLALGQNDDVLLAKAIKKVASLPMRIKGTVELVGAYKTLIGLEREVFGIKGESTPGETIDEFLSKLNDA